MSAGVRYGSCTTPAGVFGLRIASGGLTAVASSKTAISTASRDSECGRETRQRSGLFALVEPRHVEARQHSTGRFGNLDRDFPAPVQQRRVTRDMETSPAFTDQLTPRPSRTASPCPSAAPVRRSRRPRRRRSGGRALCRRRSGGARPAGPDGYCRRPDRRRGRRGRFVVEVADQADADQAPAACRAAVVPDPVLSGRRPWGFEQGRATPADAGTAPLIARVLPASANRAERWRRRAWSPRRGRRGPRGRRPCRSSRTCPTPPIAGHWPSPSARFAPRLQSAQRLMRAFWGAGMLGLGSGCNRRRLQPAVPIERGRGLDRSQLLGRVVGHL